MVAAAIERGPLRGSHVRDATCAVRGATCDMRAVAGRSPGAGAGTGAATDPGQQAPGCRTGMVAAAIERGPLRGSHVRDATCAVRGATCMYQPINAPRDEGIASDIIIIGAGVRQRPARLSGRWSPWSRSCVFSLLPFFW